MAKNNIEPKNILYEYWEITAMGRLRNNDNNNIQNSIQLFPCLKSSLGPYHVSIIKNPTFLKLQSLLFWQIDLDFKYLYSNSGALFLNKFNVFKEKLKKYSSTNIISKSSDDILNNNIKELNNPSKVGE